MLLIDQDDFRSHASFRLTEIDPLSRGILQPRDEYFTESDRSDLRAISASPYEIILSCQADA